MPALFLWEEVTMEISDRCRRCCEAGADHDIDERGNLVYNCNGCRFYYMPPMSWIQRILMRIEVMKYFYLRRVKAPGSDQLG